jgi:exodeoxyribonuclease (lambda-induced)
MPRSPLSLGINSKSTKIINNAIVDEVIPLYDISNNKTFIPPTLEQINKRYIFDPDSWIDCGNFWLNTAPQGSDPWFQHRKFRLTASNFGAAIGKSSYCTPLDIALDITNIKSKTHNKFQDTKRDPDDFSFYNRHKFNSQHGVITEPKAREWYCRTRNVKVVEVGLAVPKWETRIGASLDGDIVGTDGMIEIKSPLEMYESLRNHTAKIKTGWRPPPFYHNHIWETHYAQMQGGMKITGKKWCDYIVYATESNLSYVERVLFNPTYWDTILWPGIQNFLNNVMEPLIVEEY